MRGEFGKPTTKLKVTKMMEYYIANGRTMERKEDKIVDIMKLSVYTPIEIIRLKSFTFRNYVIGYHA